MENKDGNNGGCIGGIFVLIVIIALGYFGFNFLYKAIDSFDFSSLFSTTTDTSINYETIKFSTLYDEWSDNKARAKQKYEDKYVSISNVIIRSYSADLKSMTITDNDIRNIV